MNQTILFSCVTDKYSKFWKDWTLLKMQSNAGEISYGTSHLKAHQFSEVWSNVLKLNF